MGQVPTDCLGKIEESRMTDFFQFCQGYGVILDRLPPIGRWVRVKTIDKPHHRNGAVKWMGDAGFVQNWASMDEPALWRDQSTRDVVQKFKAVNINAQREVQQLADKAAKKAATLLSACSMDVHPYFERKGFPEHVVAVSSDGDAIIPMRRGHALIGCQIISVQGDKKFLYGQRSGGAEFVMGQRGQHFLCEGYATALSAQVVLRNLKAPYVLHVCFSAGNMKKIAANLSGGIVLADNDASGIGERVAREIGWPYWMSDMAGEDLNDAHQRLGAFALAMQLRGILMKRSAA